MGRHFFQVLTFILVSLNFELAKSQYRESEPDCQTYCRPYGKECSQYFPGSEFSPCVRAHVHCSWCFPLPILIFFIIIGTVAFAAISGCVFRMCRKRNNNFERFTVSGSAALSIPIVRNNFSQSGPPHYYPLRGIEAYPNATAPSSVPLQSGSHQFPYNPAVTNYNSTGNIEDPPPRYSEVAL